MRVGGNCTRCRVGAFELWARLCPSAMCVGGVKTYLHVGHECFLSLVQPYAAARLIFLEMLGYLKGVNAKEWKHPKVAATAVAVG